LLKKILFVQLYEDKWAKAIEEEKLKNKPVPCHLNNDHSRPAFEGEVYNGKVFTSRGWESIK